MTTAKKPAGLRVVLDTNVYFSAFTSTRGAPCAVWRKAILGEYTLVVSPQIIQELGGVLRKKAAWQDPEVIAVLKLLAKVGKIVSPTSRIDAIVSDDADNRILECALDGEADLIVFSDHHLRRLKSFQEIAIVHPADFRRTLGK